VQNNELVEANEKLQKEMGMLRTLAKEAILEKKKSQAALETLKHRVVHLLGEHNMVPKQDALKQDPAAQPSTGWCLCFACSLCHSFCPSVRPYVCLSVCCSSMPWSAWRGITLQPCLAQTAAARHSYI